MGVIGTMDSDPYYNVAQNVLYDLWYEYAERLVERIIEVCQLTDDMALLLRQIYLKPNGFTISIK